jgi:hypothetical protein
MDNVTNASTHTRRQSLRTECGVLSAWLYTCVDSRETRGMQCDSRLTLPGATALLPVMKQHSPLVPFEAHFLHVILRELLVIIVDVLVLLDSPVTVVVTAQALEAPDCHLQCTAHDSPGPECICFFLQKSKTKSIPCAACDVVRKEGGGKKNENIFV